MEHKKRSKKHIKIHQKYIKLHNASRSIAPVMFRITFIMLFFAIVFLIVLFARGYRIDFEKRTILPTGILAISSSPKAAKVYLNGEFKGVTDVNLTLPPGSYTVEIKKDGYQSFQKTLSLKGELVEAIDPVLFPVNPSLSPVTNLGIVKAIQVNESDRIILFSDKDSLEQDGIYLFDAAKKTLSFFPPLKLIVLKQNLPQGVSLKDASVTFSYDFKQAIFDFSVANGQPVSYLMSLEEDNTNFLDVTNNKQVLIEAWAKERRKEELKVLETFKKEVSQIASDSFQILAFSPDQTKLMYRSQRNIALPLVIKPPLIAANQTPEDRHLRVGNLYVYDSKEDKNFKIGNSDFDISTIHWYADSKRLVFNETTQLAISLYDGQNKQTVYSGPIERAFFGVSSDGRLLILANLNPLSNRLPDVYSVGIR